MNGSAIDASLGFRQIQHCRSWWRSRAKMGIPAGFRYTPRMESSSPERSRLGSGSLWGRLLILTYGRLLINTAVRIPYPFLPAIARGLGVPLADVSRLVALRSSVGLTGPLLSPLSERFGRRFSLLLGMLLLMLGGLVLGLRPGFWPLAFMFVMVGLAKVIYDPSMLAYLGDVIPYRQRGKAISVTELSWAVALLVGAPLAGWAIARQGWAAPFVWIGALAVVALVLVGLFMPPGRVAFSQAVNLRSMFSVLRRRPVIWAAAMFTFFIMGAQELLLIVFGDWLETEYELSLTSLGLTAAVIGVSELCGELVAGVTVDRFGKRPVVILAGLLATASYLTIPFISFSLASVMVGLFVLFFMFELTIVGSIPLLTEVLPRARSVVIAFSFAAGGLGRVVGALIGPAIWANFHLTGVGVAAGVTMFLAVLVLTFWVREAPEEPDPSEVSAMD
jgi:predicted MFS family arabinose efflux permease